MEAVDLRKAYHRVQFELLLELLVRYGVSLTLTLWLTAALQEKGGHTTRKLGNWISTPQQLTIGLGLSPAPYNVYTVGLADLNSNGLSLGLAAACGRLIDKTGSDTHSAVTAVQKQLGKVQHNGAKRQGQKSTRPVVHPQRQSNRMCNAGGLQRRSHRTHGQPQISGGPLRQNTHGGGFNLTQV